jgi:hypothetical protein
MYLKYVSNKQKKWVLRTNKIFWGILRATDEKSRIRIRNPVYGSKYPSTSQNITDPEHCSVSRDPFILKGSFRDLHLIKDRTLEQDLDKSRIGQSRFSFNFLLFFLATTVRFYVHTIMFYEIPPVLLGH